MKKLTLSDLDLFQVEIPQLSEYEKKFVIGGDDNSGILHISGGTLYADNGGTTYIGDDGSVCFFAGVNFTTGGVTGDAAYQLDGYIHIGQDWANNGFSVNDFSHEYGHYMQQEQMGDLAYYANVAGPSVWSAATDPDNHASQPYEIDASQQGSNYYNQNVTRL